MKTIAIANRKGGVGKTSTVINLGAALNRNGRKVLLVDLDSSGDLTAHSGIELDDKDSTIFEVLTTNKPITDTIKTIEMDDGISYDLLPADEAMENLVYSLEPGKQTKLRSVLNDITGYDYIILDTPPTANMATIQALAACEGVIIPAPPTYLGFRGIMSMAELIAEVKQNFNPAIDLTGIVLTNFNPRSRHHQDVKNAIADSMPDALFKTTISSAIAVAESAAEGMNLYTYIHKNPIRKKARPVIQYEELAKELEERLA